jgi:hypothetical protein
LVNDIFRDRFIILESGAGHLRDKCVDVALVISFRTTLSPSADIAGLEARWN